MSNIVVTNIAFLATFILGTICAVVSLYMFKTNKIPCLNKHDPVSVDEPRQAGVLFVLFSILGYSLAANLCLSIPPVSDRIPDWLDIVFKVILFLSGLSLPVLLIYASYYGRHTRRVFGYINTRAAQPHLKKYYRPISTLMLIAGLSSALGGITLALQALAVIPDLPLSIPGIFFAIGVITCFAMSGIMMIMEHDIKRSVQSAKPTKKSRRA